MISRNRTFVTVYLMDLREAPPHGSFLIPSLQGYNLMWYNSCVLFVYKNQPYKIQSRAAHRRWPPQCCTYACAHTHPPSVPVNPQPYMYRPA